MTDDLIDKGMERRRSLEAALAHLRTKYERRPDPELARMIKQLEDEISARERNRSKAKHGAG